MDQFTALWREVMALDIWPALASPTARFWYSWSGLGLFVSGSVIWAVYDLRQFLSSGANQVPSFRGRPPVRDDARKRRAAKIRQHMHDFLTRTGLIGVRLVVVPVLALVVITVFADWFFNGHGVLVDRQSGASVAHAGTGQLALFVADTLLKGAVFDIAEVFRIDLAAVQNDTSNWVYSGYLVLVRFLLDGFALSLIVNAVTSAWRLNRAAAAAEQIPD
jgi:hypothetical protein